MAMPCPSCKNPLDLTLQFILDNPVSVCPHCKVVMNFETSNIATDTLRKGLRDMDNLKKKYSNIAKFS
tara:strand:- start:799 stop:1002 length:204 start_codon:yes stop_codon:yes gene_type:complete